MNYTFEDSRPQRPIGFSFTLTRLQRVLIPEERTVTAIIGGPMLIWLATLFVVGVVTEPLSGLVWIMGGLFLLSFCIWGGKCISFVRNIFASEYFNTVLIEDESVIFGYNGLQLQVARRGYFVRKGLLGTTVACHYPTGFTLVMPKHIVPLHEAKRLFIEPAKNTETDAAGKREDEETESAC